MTDDDDADDGPGMAHTGGATGPWGPARGGGPRERLRELWFAARVGLDPFAPAGCVSCEPFLGAPPGYIMLKEVAVRGWVSFDPTVTPGMRRELRATAAQARGKVWLLVYRFVEREPDGAGRGLDPAPGGVPATAPFAGLPPMDFPQFFGADDFPEYDD